jgi:disulfide bond formation protein DsbB
MMSKEKIYLYLAWVLACIMMLSSLYLNLIQHREPCTLCWYERMCVFPLTIILGVALYQNFLSIFAYVIAFPVFGILFSGFHIALQEIPNFRPFRVCSSTVSCATKESIGLGFISPPMLVCTGCILLIILLSCSKSRCR